MTTTGSESRFTDALGQDVRHALRSVRTSPGYAATVVISLALALGASAAAFAVMDAVRFRALPFKDGDRLVMLSEVAVGDGALQRAANGAVCGSGCQVSYVTFDKVLSGYAIRSLDAVAGYTSGLKTLTAGGEVIPVQGGVVSRNLFDLLGVRPVRGRVFTANDDRVGATPTVVLSHDMWVNRFGEDPNILGRIVKLSDTQYTVIGVMPAGFDHEAGSVFWLPAVPTLDPSTRPSIRSLTVVGRLRTGATLDQLRAELSTVEPAVTAGPVQPKTRLEANPLRARYTASTQSHDLMLAAIVGCILLIACANLANLTLVRTLHQQRELAIRASLGASASRLARHQLVQQIVLVLLAAALGLVLARWALSVLSSLAVLNSIRPTGMEYRLDLRVVGFAIALAVLIAGLLSAVPSRLIAAVDPQAVMRDGAPTTSGSRWGNRTQRVFVVAQIASAVVLLSGAALMAKTVWYLSRADLGFAVAPVLQGTPSLPHPWRVREKFVPVSHQILDALVQLPGAWSAAIRASVALGPRSATTGVTLRGNASPLAPALTPSVAYAVTPEYFQTLGIGIARGRPFLSSDVEASVPVALVNEWAARHWWPGKDAIGETMQVDTAAGVGHRITLTVIGVVRDNKAARPSILLADDGPEIYRPFAQAPTAFPTFFVRAAGAPAPLLRAMRDVLVRLVPDRPTFATLVSETVGTQLRGVRTNALQIVAFAAVGLVLALMGIYGVFSYAVSRRTREIGIRGALGASRGAIRAMVLRDALGLTLIGLAIGIPLATAATRIIGSLLHGTSPTDAPAYVAVGLGVIVVSLGASYLPARRAARVDPIVALRSR